MFSSVQVVDGIPGSDHIAVDFIIEGKIKRVSTRKRTIYNFNKADRDLYDDLLSKVQRDSCFRFSSIDEICCNFNVTVFEIADLCIPKISMKNQYRGGCHLTLCYSYVGREHLPNTSVQRSHSVFSNLVRSRMREDHRQYINQITSSLHDNQTPFWIWLSGLRRVGSTIPNILFGGNKYSLPMEKAEILNKFFDSVFIKEGVHPLDKLDKLLMGGSSFQCIDNMTFDEENVFHALVKTDPMKSCGPDEVPGRLLKMGATWLHQPLCRLFHYCFQLGQLPRDWRRANIVPIIKKKGQKNFPNNHVVQLVLPV